MLLYCPNCGNQIPNEYSFCSKCGRDIRDLRKSKNEVPHQEKVYYAKAANGMMVRVPASKYENWKRVQDQIRAGTYKPDEERAKRLADSILKDSAEKKEQPKSFAQVYKERCPNCGIPLKSKADICISCGLSYKQAEKIAEMKKEQGMRYAMPETEKAESVHNEKSKSVLFAALRYVLGFIAAFFSFSIVYAMLYWMITLIGRIPVLGTIIYWPSDAAWIRLVTASGSAVFAGAWVSLKISRTAKPFSIALFCLYLYPLLNAIISSVISWTFLFECGVIVICSIICFFIKEGDG